MNAVDANVFVYAYDIGAPTKQSRALDLLQRLKVATVDTFLLWQVAGEVLNVFRKWESKGRMTTAQVEASFNGVTALFPIVPSPFEVFARSFELRSLYTLSHWDSMLLAAAKATGVTTLYSEDMQNGCDYDGVVVVNPFLG